MLTNRIPNKFFDTHKESYKFDLYVETRSKIVDGQEVKEVIEIDVIAEVVKYLRIIDNHDDSYFLSAASGAVTGGRVYRNVDCGKGSKRKNFEKEDLAIKNLLLKQTAFAKEFIEDLREIDLKNPITIDTVFILHKVRRKVTNTLLNHPECVEFLNDVMARYTTSTNDENLQQKILLNKETVKNNLLNFINFGFLFTDQFTDIVSEKLGVPCDAKNAAIPMFVNPIYNSLDNPYIILKQLREKLANPAKVDNFSLEQLIYYIESEDHENAKRSASGLIYNLNRLFENTSSAVALSYLGDDPIIAVHKKLIEQLKNFAKIKINSKLKREISKDLLDKICTYLKTNFDPNKNSKELMKYNLQIQMILLINTYITMFNADEKIKDPELLHVQAAILKRLMETDSSKPLAILQELTKDHIKCEKMIYTAILTYLKDHQSEIKNLDPKRFKLWFVYLRYANQRKYALENRISKKYQGLKTTFENNKQEKKIIHKRNSAGDISAIPPKAPIKKRPGSTALNAGILKLEFSKEKQREDSTLAKAQHFVKAPSVKALGVVAEGVNKALEIPSSSNRSSGPGEDLSKKGSSESRGSVIGKGPKSSSGSPKLPVSNSTSAVLQTVKTHSAEKKPNLGTSTPPAPTGVEATSKPILRRVFGAFNLNSTKIDVLRDAGKSKSEKSDQLEKGVTPKPGPLPLN